MKQEVEKWIAELTAAGWVKHFTLPYVWVSPWGGWYRGPYKAWRIMKECEKGQVR